MGHTEEQRSDTAFSNEAVICVRRSQAAFADLLSGAGLGGARPTEVGRKLGLDKTLAWKVSRFTDSTDLVKAVKHIPGTGGIEIVLQAAQDYGVSMEHIEAVRKADDAFRSFVEQRAGDRRSFEAMLAAGDRDERGELEERKAFFQSGSTIWGVRADVQFLTLCLRPSSTLDDRIDVLQMGGLINFERLRSDVPWIIRRLWTSDSDGSSDTEFQREPIDKAAADGTALPILPEFCSQPLPQINQFTGHGGVIYDELAPGDIGKFGALTCVTGELYTGALPLRRSEDNTYGRYELMLRTPVRAVIFDIYLHESLTHFGHFNRAIYGLLEDRPGIGKGRSHDTPMFAPEPAIRLGSPPIVQNNRIGNYSTMLGSTLKRAGWGSLESFRGYRCEIEYPAAPWCLTMECPIQ